MELNDDTIIDRSNGNDVTVSKREFVEELQAIEEAGYSIEESYRMVFKTKHFGPWHK